MCWSITYIVSGFAKGVYKFVHQRGCGDGVLYMANFFERMSKSLRKFYGTLPQEEIAAAKVDVDPVIPWERGGHEEGDK